MPIEVTKAGQQPKTIALPDLYMEIIRDVADGLRGAGRLDDEPHISPADNPADSQAVSVQSKMNESTGKP